MKTNIWLIIFIIAYLIASLLLQVNMYNDLQQIKMHQIKPMAAVTSVDFLG